MAKNGLTDAEKCLAEKCADYVMSDKHNDSMAISTLRICATQDVQIVVVYLQAFAASVLFEYIKSHQTSDDLADQLFGKSIQGK